MRRPLLFLRLPRAIATVVSRAYGIGMFYLAGTVFVTACDARSAAETGAADAPAGVIDSALPIPVLLERFRATTTDTPSVLRGGAERPEVLVRALLAAVSARDTATLRALVMTRAEFAWLYYPFTKFVSRPYELGPELVWLQHVAGSETGAVRLLERYGGARLRFEALLCADSVLVEGPNRITPGCRVRFAAADSAPRTMQLFAGLLARDGRYKFLSYANDL
ncbi:MAG: hypothetical protein FJ361_04740 [Gemmatimonadetes bacterium]|nr:hypothetical protein [Gemmatimonadota bacterium]